MPDGGSFGRISLLIGGLNGRVRALWRESGASASHSALDETETGPVVDEPSRGRGGQPSRIAAEDSGPFVDWDRPYKDLSVQELEEVWSSDPGDPDLEEVLLQELGHRTSVDARILKFRLVEGDY